MGREHCMLHMCCMRLIRGSRVEYLEQSRAEQGRAGQSRVPPGYFLYSRWIFLWSLVQIEACRDPRKARRGPQRPAERPWLRSEPYLSALPFGLGHPF